MSYVARSKYRVDVFEHLAETGPSLPSAMAEVLDIPASHVSRALNNLRDKGLAKLLVDEDTKKGRIYGLTERGETLVPHVEDFAEGSA